MSRKLRIRPVVRAGDQVPLVANTHWATGRILAQETETADALDVALSAYAPYLAESMVLVTEFDLSLNPVGTDDYVADWMAYLIGD